MATPLAYIAYDPEPQLPLLADTLPADPQTEIQREVQANLQYEIDSVLLQITDPQDAALVDASVATYGFTIFFGSTTRSNSASVTKPSFKAAALSVRSLSIA